MNKDSISKKKAGKQMIDDRLKRINFKSKRKRTLIKKVIEFSQMCNVAVLLVIHDAEFNKVIEYNSGTSSDLFTLKEATNVLDLASNKKVIHKYFTNDDYEQFCKDKLDFDDDNLRGGLPLRTL